MLTGKLSAEEGAFLVRLARRAVETYLRNAVIIDPPPETPPSLMQESGAFVTIEALRLDRFTGRVRRELRGCIGYPEPLLPLAEAVIRAAIAAATEDPRFPPLTPRELDNVIFEVSVLTPPQLVHYREPAELLEKVKVGRDGLMVELGGARGLLLPQVPVEEGWSVEKFLSYACLKAGLPEDAWKTSRLRVYTFQAQIFVEATPGGDVVERVLEPLHE
ncbi:MAG: TIGR00296 family protein [Thermofilum sp.]